jgi:PadR family transcriptional regulator, regulatory protein PadR
MATNARPATTENWETQLRKGWLELAILASLWGGELYGLDIIRRLDTDSDLLLAEGTIYPILGRLKRDGLIDSKWVEAEAGHPRKYYWLTAEGRGRVVAMARYASTFLSRIASLIEPLIAKEAP